MQPQIKRHTKGAISLPPPPPHMKEKLILQVRRWDAETGTNTETHNGRKAVSCIAAPRGGRDLVAFAGAAKTLHLWDPRQRHAENAVPPPLPFPWQLYAPRTCLCQNFSYSIPAAQVQSVRLECCLLPHSPWCYLPSAQQS